MEQSEVKFSTQEAAKNTGATVSNIKHIIGYGVVKPTWPRGTFHPTKNYFSQSDLDKIKHYLETSPVRIMRLKREAAGW